MSVLVQGEHTVKNLVDLLSYRAYHTPGKIAFRFLTNGEEDDLFTYGMLHTKAQKIAAVLQQRNACGKRALLLYHSGPDYVK
ncbi:hypothetical protein [Shouchella lonarensis]|uniref:Uncharacterized protein n=1 Tax=Shouchella lonarensis TaxID=1464122 RepID=A0A1G6N2E2_9BACI|nr:hypothetical protein [Shouchella lonarensis]SDC61983.1 hypothetical protein SAMN05421737_11181 [Shouchella lonarensis]